MRSFLKPALFSLAFLAFGCRDDSSVPDPVGGTGQAPTTGASGGGGSSGATSGTSTTATATATATAGDSSSSGGPCYPGNWPVLPGECDYQSPSDCANDYIYCGAGDDAYNPGAPWECCVSSAHADDRIYCWPMAEGQPTAISCESGTISTTADTAADVSTGTTGPWPGLPEVCDWDGSSDHVTCSDDPGPAYDCCTDDSGDLACWADGDPQPADVTCDPCPGQIAYQCNGRKMAIYELDGSNPAVYSVDPAPGVGETQLEQSLCFPSLGFNVAGAPEPAYYGDPLIVCGPDMPADLTSATDPVTAEIAALCLLECDAAPYAAHQPATFVGGGSQTWTRVDYRCEVGPGLTANSQFDYMGTPVQQSNSIPCNTTGDQVAVEGFCDGGAGEGDECVEASTFAECSSSSWDPARWVHAAEDSGRPPKTVIDDDFWDALTLSQVQICDGDPAFVYSVSGQVAYIDGADVGEFLYELGLRDGAMDFELREENGLWYPANSDAEVIAALAALSASTKTVFEARYQSPSEDTQVTREIHIVDCEAAGETKQCDSRDLP